MNYKRWIPFLGFIFAPKLVGMLLLLGKVWEWPVSKQTKVGSVSLYDEGDIEKRRKHEFSLSP